MLGAFALFAHPAAAQSDAAPPAFTTGDYTAWATVEIEIGDTPEDVGLRVTFTRGSDGGKAFVITAINTNSSDSFPNLQNEYDLRIAPLEALLTGDFFLQPAPGEYWIGTQMGADELSKTLQFNVPRFLVKADDILNRYELVINDQSVSFEPPAANGARILFVPVIRYLLRIPAWAAANFSNPSQWLALEPNLHAFQPRDTATALRVMINQSIPGPTQWLSAKLAIAVAGFATSLILFVLFYDMIEPRTPAVRLIPLAAAALLVALIFAFGDPEKQWAQTIFYDGAFFLGAAVPPLIFAALPQSALTRVRKFIQQIHSDAPSTVAENPQGGRNDSN